MKVASIQMSVVEGDKAATIDKAIENIHRCEGSDLAILPEIWNIGFMSFDRYLSEAEDSMGQTLKRLRTAAKEVGVYLHTGSFVEEKKGKYYNSSYLISPDGDVLANYLKVHLFGYNSKETQLLSPGDSIVTVGTPLGTFGLATCYDLRFPELFRRMVEQSAEIFLVCSAWPYPRLEHWLMLNRVRALENFMDEKGYKTIDDMLGIASDAAMAYCDMPAEKARVIEENCINCKMCLKACFSDAMQDGEKHTWVNTENCIGCGGCYSVCPAEGAIEIDVVSESEICEPMVQH